MLYKSTENYELFCWFNPRAWRLFYFLRTGKDSIYEWQFFIGCFQINKWRPLEDIPAPSELERTRDYMQLFASRLRDLGRQAKKLSEQIDYYTHMHLHAEHFQIEKCGCKVSYSPSFWNKGCPLKHKFLMEVWSKDSGTTEIGPFDEEDLPEKILEAVTKKEANEESNSPNSHISCHGHNL